MEGKEAYEDDCLRKPDQTQYPNCHGTARGAKLRASSSAAIHGEENELLVIRTTELAPSPLDHVPSGRKRLLSNAATLIVIRATCRMRRKYNKFHDSTATAFEKENHHGKSLLLRPVLKSSSVYREMHEPLIDGSEPTSSPLNGATSGRGVKEENPQHQTLFLKLFFACLWNAMKERIILLMIAAITLIVWLAEGENGSAGGKAVVNILVPVTAQFLSKMLSDMQLCRCFYKVSKRLRNFIVLREGRWHRMSILDIAPGDILELSNASPEMSSSLSRGPPLPNQYGDSTTEDLSVVVDEESQPVLSERGLLGCQRFTVDSCTMERRFLVVKGKSESEGHDHHVLMIKTADPTPLECCLEELTRWSSRISMIWGILMSIIVLIISQFTVRLRQQGISLWFTIAVVFQNFLSILEVIKPEGAELVLTLSMARCMRKMMRDGAYVCSLSACENLGFAKTICTDKTGTLTKGTNMRVKQAWIAGDMREDLAEVHAPICEMLQQGIVENECNGTGENAEINKALHVWARVALRPRVTTAEKMKEEPFNSTTMCEGVAVKNRTFPDGIPNLITIHWKGPAQNIVDMCSKSLNAANAQILMDKPLLQNVVSGMSAKKLQCVGLAYTTSGPGIHDNLSDELPKDELTLLGIFGLRDECRPDVANAVVASRNAGMMIRLVTADHICTAKAIATDCGILGNGDEAIESSVFFGGSTQVQHPAVLASASSAKKVMFVNQLKKAGEDVFVISNAMGSCSLRESLVTNMQLSEGFGCVPKMIEHSRRIPYNLRVFFAYHLPFDTVVVLMSLVGAVFPSLGSPLSNAQLLWLNLLNDTLAPVALTCQDPTDLNLSEMKELFHRDTPLLDNSTRCRIWTQALYQLAVVFLFQTVGLKWFKFAGDLTLNDNTTIIFTFFILCQILNQIYAHCNSPSGVWRSLCRNGLFLTIVILSLLVHVCIVEVPSINYFDTARLQWKPWMLCAVAALLCYPIASLAEHTMPALDLLSEFRSCLGAIPEPKEPFLVSNPEARMGTPA